jgi:hypothetical protein
LFDNDRDEDAGGTNTPHFSQTALPPSAQLMLQMPLQALLDLCLTYYQIQTDPFHISTPKPDITAGL